MKSTLTTAISLLIALAAAACANPVTATSTITETGYATVTTIPTVTTTVTATTPPTSATTVITLTVTGIPGAYNQFQLEYLLLANYPDYFWCDPDFYPIARPDGEQTNAIQQFPSIRANAVEFSAILEHLGLPGKTDYSDAEKLDIYRQHKVLTDVIVMTAAAGAYNYSLRTGQNQGWRITGTISTAGQIKELAREASFNTCPICLTAGTLIATPGGDIPVELLRPGMAVWTVDATGQRAAAPVVRVSSTPVPLDFKVLKITLGDGRSVTASPGHPSADWRPLADYHPGENLDGSRVVSIETLTYSGGATYDLLPAGGTGVYWAGGIRLLSTLS